MIPINRSYVIMPSLGLGYLASLLKKKNHEVKILHCIKEGLSFEDFKEYMQKNRFDVVGIQMMTYDLNPTSKHAKIIKSISPETIIVAGGAHPSGDRAFCPVRHQKQYRRPSRKGFVHRDAVCLSRNRETVFSTPDP